MKVLAPSGVIYHIFEKANRSSRDQVGCLRSLQEACGRWLGMRIAGAAWAPLDSWGLVFLEAVLEADLITA